MSYLQKIREWCSDKDSPWFTRKDAQRILAPMELDVVDAWLSGWENRGDVRRKKGSRWYKISVMNLFPSTPRYRVDFSRVQVPRVKVSPEVHEKMLRGKVADAVVFDEAAHMYDMDIQEVLNDSMLKDILAEEAE